MAGKKPIKVYEYNLRGEYIGRYDNIQSARTKYYREIEGKIPMFRYEALGLPYELTPEGTILYKQRVGRGTTKLLMKVINSPFYKVAAKDDRAIIMTDLEGNFLGTFANIKVASLVLKDMSYNKIFRRLNKSSKAVKPDTLYHLEFLQEEE